MLLHIVRGSENHCVETDYSYSGEKMTNRGAFRALWEALLAVRELIITTTGMTWRRLTCKQARNLEGQIFSLLNTNFFWLCCSHPELTQLSHYMIYWSDFHTPGFGDFHSLPVSLWIFDIQCRHSIPPSSGFERGHEQFERSTLSDQSQSQEGEEGQLIVLRLQLAAEETHTLHFHLVSRKIRKDRIRPGADT